MAKIKGSCVTLAKYRTLAGLLHFSSSIDISYYVSIIPMVQVKLRQYVYRPVHPTPLTTYYIPASNDDFLKELTTIKVITLVSTHEAPKTIFCLIPLPPCTTAPTDNYTITDFEITMSLVRACASGRPAGRAASPTISSRGVKQRIPRAARPVDTWPYVTISSGPAIAIASGLPTIY